MSATVTFLVPFVSGTDLLLRAVQSVRAQTVDDWALVVLDNAGPEPEVAARVAELGDSRVTVERAAEHVGMAANWNRCLDRITTPLGVLLHSDDELAPTYLAEVLRLARVAPDAAAYFTGGITIDESSRPMFSLADRTKALIAGRKPLVDLRGETGLRQLLIGNFVFASSVCFRMERLGDRRYSEDLSFVTDMELLGRLLLEGERLVGTTARACRYRRHAAQATMSLNRDLRRLDEEHALYASLRARAREQGWSRAARMASVRPTVRLNAGVLAGAALLRGEARLAARTAAGAFKG